jgi:RNA polymerase sigma-70 factor (ECF subfamily)
MNSLSNEIIEQLNKKQMSAFEAMFKLYYPRLVYFAKEYVSYEDARNLVQDAFASFWEMNPVFLNEFQLQSYLYTVVKNNCLMNLRRNKLAENYVDSYELKMQNQVYSLALEQMDTSVLAFNEMEAIIERTLNELPVRCREIFIKSRIEGKTNKQVAEELSISVKAVEAQLTKAKKIFKIALKDFLPILAYILQVN